MNRYPVFFRWLVWAALADWLVGRTLLRSAIFMPKSPPVIMIYQGVGLLSQLAATASGLLVLVALSWLAWDNLRPGKNLLFPFALVSLAFLSLLFLFIPPAGALVVSFYLNLILAIGWLGLRAMRMQLEVELRIAVALVALALLASSSYLLLPALYGALNLSGPPGFAGMIFNLGEFLVVLAAVSLGWAYSRPLSRRAWLMASIPAMAFTALHLANPAMAGIISIWSTGLSLYLPWPLYTIGLWLAGLAVFSSLERREPAGLAILLLAAGGYTPQLSSHAFWGIAALAMLVPFPELARDGMRLYNGILARKEQESQYPV